MKMQIDEFNVERMRPERRALRMVPIVLLSAIVLVAMIALLQPGEAAAKPAESAEVPVVRSSPVVTYQAFLPLIMNNVRTPSTFGVQFYGSLSSSTGFTRAVELGTTWLRIPLQWASIEPANTTPDHYNWASSDAIVQTAQNAGMKLIFTLDINPSWAASKPGGPVTNTADLQEFLGAAVARYPYVLYWEIYNEPDSVARFAFQGSAYGTLLSNLYPTIKAANPAANVVLGGLAMDWFTDKGGYFDRTFLTTTLASCAGTCFDVANFHYYPAFRGEWENYGPDIIGKATRMRQLMSSYGFSRPVIATETDWPAGTNWGSPELAARYVAKVYARSLAADLKATVWFAMTDADSSLPGLLDSTTTPSTLVPRPAYRAYQTLNSLLAGATYDGVAYALDPIEGYRFTAGGKRLEVYWYDCPYVRLPSASGPQDCSNTGTLQIVATRIGVIDKFGAVVIKNDGDDGVTDGKVKVTVGSSPLYIDYNP